MNEKSVAIGVLLLLVRLEVCNQMVTRSEDCVVICELFCKPEVHYSQGGLYMLWDVE